MTRQYAAQTIMNLYGLSGETAMRLIPLLFERLGFDALTDQAVIELARLQQAEEEMQVNRALQRR
jgi:hypothetical protein